MYCTKCGNQLNGEEKYCTTCGEATQKEPPIKKNNTSSDQLPLILGILSCIFCAIPFLSIPLAIVSIITGINQKKETGKFQVSIILGIISIVLTILFTLLIIFFIMFAVDYGKEWMDNFQFDDIIEQYTEDFYQETNTFDIKGYSWLADDESMLYLNTDYTYIWYQRDKNHEDNYYQGNFTFYTGEEAIKYIAEELKEYGFTEEEQRQQFKNNLYKLKDYYIIKLTCEKTKINGQEQEGTNKNAYYYGFYSSSKKRLDLINLETAASAGFTLNEKLNKIDI